MTRFVFSHFLAVLLFASVESRAERFAVKRKCPDHFAVLSQVAASLDRGLVRDNQRSSELIRVDAILNTEIANSIRGLPVSRQKRLLQVAAAAELLDDTVLKGSGAQLSFNGEKPIVGLLMDLVDHPYGRIAFRHEFTHLLSLDEKHITSQGALLAAQRRLWNFRKDEEIKAYGDQYDFIRKLYRSEDLARLRKDFPTEPSPTDIETLKKYRMIARNAQGRWVLEPRVNSIADKDLDDILKREPGFTAALDRFVVLTPINRMFHDDVQKALLLTKHEYCRDALAHPVYQSAIRADHRDLVSYRLKQFGILTGAGLGGFVGFQAYKVYDQISRDIGNEK